MQQFQEFLFLTSLKHLVEQLKYFAFAVLELNLILKWVHILSAVSNVLWPLGFFTDVLSHRLVLSGADVGV